MMAKGILSLSSLKKTVLLPEKELFQQDAITCCYQDEQAFREAKEIRMLIDTFFDTEKNYRTAIQNKQDKDGKIQLEYRGNDGGLYHVTPLYKEDLDSLGLKEFQQDAFIKKIKNRILSSLKEEDATVVERFFRHHTFLFAGEYQIRKGYFKWLGDLQYKSAGEKAKTNLFSMLRNHLTPSYQETNLDVFYFWARVIYDYAKKNNLIKKKISHNKVTLKTPPVQSSSLVQKSKTGTIESFENYFLRTYSHDGPVRMADAAIDFEEAQGKRRAPRE